MPPKRANTQRNWPRSRQTSFWPLAARSWGHCSDDPYGANRVSSRPIRSAPASSRAWRGRAATHRLCRSSYDLGGKWLELLKEIAPGVTRAAVLRDPAISQGISQFAVIQSAAPVARGGGQPGQHARRWRDRARRRGLRSCSRRRPDRGGGPGGDVHRELIIKLAARHKLPAVYYERDFVAAGGWSPMGLDTSTSIGAPATYVDRILKGEKPADLPVQAPTKYER